MELLGWLVGVVALIWATIAIAFVTISTFSPGLIAEGGWKRVLGIAMWIILAYAWYSWLGFISIEVN